MQFEAAKETNVRAASQKEAFLKKRRSEAIKIVNQLANKENNNQISFKKQSFAERFQILIKKNTKMAKVFICKRNPKLLLKQNKSDYKKDSNIQKEIKSQLKCYE